MRRIVRRAGGFSLVEALLSLTILSLVVVSFLGFLTELNDIVGVQGDVTEASESLRYSVGLMVRQIRMAGTGGLPIVAPDRGGGLVPLAVDVVDNVSPGRPLESAAGGAVWDFVAGRTPIDGTDVLRIRGILASLSYGLAAGDFTGDGRCSIPSISPWTGYQQELVAPGRTLGRPFVFAQQAPLAISYGNGESRDVSQWRVVEIEDDVIIEDSGNSRRMNLIFGDGPTNAFASLNAAGATEVNPEEIYAGGFLDDVVFLVSKNDFGGTSLYRLRVTAAGSSRIRAEELVANVVDLQVALGCDCDGDGRLAPDEWFLSRNLTAGPTGRQMASLSQVRLSIVTRTERADRRWTNHPQPHENGTVVWADRRGYRYRSMTVRIKPRMGNQPNQNSFGFFENRSRR